MFNEETLKKMLKDLGEHKRTREELYPIYVENRLNQGLINYYNELAKLALILQQKEERKVIKAMASLEKENNVQPDK